jgi:hypothetical protein
MDQMMVTQLMECGKSGKGQVARDKIEHPTPNIQHRMRDAEKAVAGDQ